MDARLTLCSRDYREKTDENQFDRIYLEPGGRVSGEARYQKMRENLLEALRDEAILLVLDNFETNLDNRCACKEPEWDALLRMLAEELPDTRSRLLMTSRHRPAALEEGVARALLGPLSMRSGEAGLFVGTHPAFQDLLHGDEAGMKLLRRLMDVSRGHPLILTRLAALAHDPAALAQALDTLEQQGFEAMPDLFAAAKSDAQQEEERRYLENVAVGSIDLLIERLPADARHLLWLITLANEPVTEELLTGVVEDLATPPPAPPRQGRGDSPLLRRGAGGEVAFTLAKLTEMSLLSQEGGAQKNDENAGRMPALPGALLFHELVKERMAAWMEGHPEERAGRGVEQVWVAYGERYAAMFDQLQRSGKEHALDAAAEAGRRGLTYLTRAKAFDTLGGFASGLVNSTRDPGLLRGVIAELQAVADQVPPGPQRWKLRTNLADALRRAVQPDQGLALYAQAAAEAEAARHWADVGWICGNWANALGDVGQLEESKATHQQAADAYRKAREPEIKIIGRELEALRIDVMQGRAGDALPEIEARLQTVRDWWQRARRGEQVPEAPNAVFLGRVLVGGLDIAEDANRQLQRWDACLSLLQEIEQTERETGAGRHEQYRTRFNQYAPLMRLGRLDDARRALEECLSVFREVDDLHAQSSVLSALADVWDERGDVEQAIALERQALSIRNRLPDPADRAASHQNLANYLGKSGNTEEDERHSLAAILYSVFAGRRDHLSIMLNNFKIKNHNSDGQYTLPHVADLLARPEFAALAHFVAQRKEDAAQLQAQVDELVSQAGQ